MTLCKDSLEWAVDFVKRHSDGDLFPRVVECRAIDDELQYFIDCVEGKPLSTFPHGANRRFIVPKDDISYRQATQLHPQDSILLSAAIHQFGQGIEDRRLAKDIVYSYRFSPSESNGLYSSKNSWNKFWSTARQRSLQAQSIAYCDIADFYNQVYHHSVENQLIASNLPNQAIKWLISLLESTTAGVSRGVPVGPHGAHLLAEASLIPIDNSMLSSGLEFIRYADDILVFCDSERSARKAVGTIAAILDKQQRLMLQRHKTKILEADRFRDLCDSMIQDRPISDDEEQVLQVIQKYSRDPYATIYYNSISEEDWKTITEDIISNIILDYINSDPVDYIRLRWFYRRLTQIGHPGAIDVSLKELDSLGPCFADICTYLASVQTIESAYWLSIGERLIALLDTEEVELNEYFRLSILSLFSRNSEINHFNNLAARFQKSDAFARREVLLAAHASGAIDWLREHKESFEQMDPWQKMAFIYCASEFPRDEKKYFLNRLSFQRPFEQTLVRWAKKRI
ncbi:MAG: reverse transcriptase domain-containing protein [Cyanobacteria bacterium J06634_5]